MIEAVEYAGAPAIALEPDATETTIEPYLWFDPQTRQRALDEERCACRGSRRRASSRAVTAVAPRLRGYEIRVANQRRGGAVRRRRMDAHGARSRPGRVVLRDDRGGVAWATLRFTVE